MTSDAARAGPLAGRCIVITRPAHQAGSLAEKVRTAGGEVIRFPVIEIAEATDLAPFYRVVDALEAFDYAIFVS
ncbi:MAG TPA: uroporphyrinogen-III synthase, partial [Usitatibacter sp.]|nr:uroporphyrinogen-III synthase [Usitatibacter sp.]